MNWREFVTWEGLLGWGYSDDACMKEFTPIQIQRIKDWSAITATSAAAGDALTAACAASQRVGVSLRCA